MVERALDGRGVRREVGVEYRLRDVDTPAGARVARVLATEVGDQLAGGLVRTLDAHDLAAFARDRELLQPDVEVERVAAELERPAQGEGVHLDAPKEDTGKVTTRTHGEPPTLRLTEKLAFVKQKTALSGHFIIAERAIESFRVSYLCAPCRRHQSRNRIRPRSLRYESESSTLGSRHFRVEATNGS